MIDRGYQTARLDVCQNIQPVKHLESGRVQRSSALIAHWRRFLFKHRDRNAGPIERQRADHTHRAGADDENPLLTLHAVLLPARSWNAAKNPHTCFRAHLMRLRCLTPAAALTW